jgi:hypothetical protein
VSRAFLDRDRLMNANSALVAEATMAITDAAQLRQPQAQVLGAAMFFLEVCRHFRVAPQDAFTAITNMTNDRDGQKPEFAAVRLYVSNEL